MRDPEKDRVDKRRKPAWGPGSLCTPESRKLANPVKCCRVLVGEERKEATVVSQLIIEIISLISSPSFFAHFFFSEGTVQSALPIPSLERR